MTKDNEDALQIAADLIAAKTADCEPLYDAATAHLRRLVAENEAKDALLRQAVEAITWRYTGSTAVELVAAINQHLEGKA